MFVQEQATILPQRRDLFVRLLALAVPVYLLVLVLGQASLFLIIGIVGVVLVYLLARQYVWVLPLLALPSLALGHVFYIPITTGWIYEARAGEVLLGLALAVFFLDQYFGKRLAYIKVDKVVFLLGLYLTVAVLSVIYVVDLRYFVFGLKAIAFGLTAYLLVYNLINTHKRIYYLLCAVTATAALLSLQLFWKFYSMGWSSQFIFERNMIFIPIGPIATASAILALLAPLVLGFYFYLPKEKKARPFLLAAFVMAFLGVFLTLGKAALGSLAVALFYLLIKNRRAETPYILVFLWFTFLAYLFFYPFVAGLFERLAKTLVDVNTQFRVTEYETGWEIIRNHPWIGVGAGQQLHYFGRFLNLDNPQLVNNYFLQPLINLGVIGLALALFIFHRLYKNTRELISGAGQYYLLAAGFAASMLAAALNGLAEVTIFALPYAIIFWSIAGVMPNIGKENI